MSNFKVNDEVRILPGSGHAYAGKIGKIFKIFKTIAIIKFKPPVKVGNSHCYATSADIKDLENLTVCKREPDWANIWDDATSDESGEKSDE